MSVLLYVMRGDSFRQILTDEEHAIAIWPLGDLVGTIAHDVNVTSHGTDPHPGTYLGTGSVNGVALDLPEGALGTTFDGNGYVEVPDDSGVPHVHNLSFAGGNIDIAFLIKTTTDDNVLRAIIQKTEPDGDGWYVALQDGAIIFRLQVAGVQIFKITYNGVADGKSHVVHCSYNATLARVRLYIDGSESATIFGPTTLPVATTANLRIASFNDDTGRFIGTLGLVMLGHEGSIDLGARLHQASTWIDISQYLINSTLEIQLGDSNADPFGSTANTGIASFELKNVDGRFSPTHDNWLDGLNVGSPIKILTYQLDGILRPLFRGFIKSLTPDTGKYGSRRAHVVATDWIEIASVSPVDVLPVQLNKKSGESFKALIDHADRPPAAVEIDANTEIFQFAFDNIRSTETKIYSEMVSLQYSEGGATYIRRDGTLVYESRGRRQVPTIPKIVMDGDFVNLEIDNDLNNVTNAVRAVVYPREVGADTETVLTLMTQRQKVLPNGTITIEGSYQDPLQKATNVGAIDLQPLLSSTDYTMTENQDGSGDNLNNSVSFDEQILGGSKYRLVVRNNEPVKTGWFQTRIRGRILRWFEPQTSIVEDRDSIRRRGLRPSSLDLKYLSNVEQGFTRASMLVSLFKDPLTRPHAIVVRPNLVFEDASEMAFNIALMDLDIGDYILVRDEQSGLHGNVGWWISYLNYEFGERFDVTITIGVVPSLTLQGLMILDDPVFGILDTAILGF